jgi:hypothetical protein
VFLIHWAKALFGVLAIVCACVSSYKIWEVERKLINALSVRIQELEWPDNHPVIRVVGWGDNPVPNGYYQKGFFLANSGPIALEVRIEDFMVGTHKWSSRIVAGIDSDREAFALAWKTDIGLLNKFDLLAEMQSNNPHSTSIHSPDFSIPINLIFRDSRNLWYRGRAEVTYIRSQHAIDVGPTVIEKLGAIKPL